MRAVLLARKQGSPNWSLDTPSNRETGNANEYRIRNEGGEAYNLSEEAMRAFFAICPEARALVRSSIVSVEPTFTKISRALLACGLSLATATGGLIIEAAIILKHHEQPLPIYGVATALGIIALLTAYTSQRLYASAHMLEKTISQGQSLLPHLRGIVDR